MRSNRLAVASTAAALTLGVMSLVPAGAQDPTPTTTVPTLTSTSLTLTCTSDPDISQFIGGPLTFGLEASVTLPESADQGAAVDWSADYTFLLSDEMIALAEGASLQEIDFTNFDLVTHPSGGISGPDVAATPTAFSVDISAGSVTVSAAGTVTVDDASIPGYLSLADPISFATSIDLGEGQTFNLTASCTSGNAVVASLDQPDLGPVPVPPAPLPPPIDANPRYAG